jgi:hypothetical protein
MAVPVGIWAGWLPVVLAGCTSTPERAAPSTVGCVNAVVATLPAGLTDPEKHCVASAGFDRMLPTTRPGALGDAVGVAPIGIDRLASAGGDRW